MIYIEFFVTIVVIIIIIIVVVVVVIGYHLIQGTIVKITIDAACNDVCIVVAVVGTCIVVNSFQAIRVFGKARLYFS
jgi:uncharacterized membrane protein